VDNDYQSNSDNIAIGVDDVALRRAYVLSRFRSLKLGTQLMNMVLAYSRVKANVFLTVWGENYSARKFDRTFGFDTIGESPECGDDGKLFGFEQIMSKRKII
jgi:ribosomal protein S18 acetylase RimI-like enzyme